MEKKYIGKIHSEWGLVITIYDIKLLTNQIIDWSVLQKIELRLIVFHPFVGEIIECRIAESTAEGLKASLKFAEVIIP